MTQTAAKHDPVLLEEVIELLDIQPTDVIIDGTLGLGGHSSKFAELTEGNGRIIGFDLDSTNLKTAQRNLKKYQGTVTFINDSFNTIDHYIKVLKLPEYNKVLLDLGLSSPHVDDPQRGFSYRAAGPLDMRFNQQKNKLTASAILHKASEEQLQTILRNYGEVRNYKKLARVIVEERENKRFRSTKDFADRISEQIRAKDASKILAQIFQALRIAVNNELNVLKEGLIKLWDNLSSGGHIAIISYHSLEDRIVKHFFKTLTQGRITHEDAKGKHRAEPEAEAVSKKVIKPKKSEVEENRRARSAKLRVYKKIS